MLQNTRPSISFAAGGDHGGDSLEPVGGLLKQQLAANCEKLPTISSKGASNLVKKSANPSSVASSIVSVNDIAAGLANAVAAAVADAVTVATIGRNLNLNLNNYSQLRQQLEMQSAANPHSNGAASLETSATSAGNQLKQFLSGTSGFSGSSIRGVSNNHHQHHQQQQQQQQHQQYHHRRNASGGGGGGGVDSSSSSMRNCLPASSSSSAVSAVAVLPVGAPSVGTASIIRSDICLQ